MQEETKKSLSKAQESFSSFKEENSSLNLDKVRSLPVEETEPQAKISSREAQKAAQIFLKPERTLPDRQVFNEKFRQEWEFQKEYVQFIAEHNEMKGEVIEKWTHPYGGVGASFWKIPTNVPVWGPRYLAEELTQCKYTRLKTTDKPNTTTQNMEFYGTLTAECQEQRLNARPVTTSRSVFF